jgi:hypothetical protein
MKLLRFTWVSIGGFSSRIGGSHIVGAAVKVLLHGRVGNHPDTLFFLQTTLGHRKRQFISFEPPVDRGLS